MRSALHEVANSQQEVAHLTVGNHSRDFRPMLLRKRQKLPRKLAQRIAVERYKMGDCDAVYDRKQQQWIFGLFPERLSLLDQLSCPLSGRFCFRRSIAFDMHEGSNERDLKA